MNNLTIKEKYSKAIVDLWKACDDQKVLNAPNSEFCKSPFAHETNCKNILQNEKIYFENS